MQRHRRWAAAFVAFFLAAGCNGDDDAGETTEASAQSTVPDPTEAPPASTAEPSTDPPATTTTTTTSTTVAPSTTLLEDELKAQIAADYQRSWQLRRDLTENPTLDGLDAKLAEISAPGSENEAMLRAFVNELVTLGERVVAGTPDEFSIDVERVDLVGDPPHQEAVVTICYICNRVRVDAAGNIVLDNGIVASRSEDHVVVTPAGWLADRGFEDVWQGLGVTECPAA